MMNKKTTKHALLTSVLALVLCCSMLVGSTFAWFADSVTSGENKIVAGNLDVELEYYKNGAWASVAGASDLFSDVKWEPGHTEVVYLKLSNLGSLALKYQLAMAILSEKAGTNVYDKSFKLSDYIYFGVEEGVNPEVNPYTPDDAGRQAAIEDVKDGAAIISTGYVKESTMTAGAEELYLALVVYMPFDVDNVANHKAADAGQPADQYQPEIKLGFSVIATQLENESDSFGPDYDADALHCDILANPTDVQQIIENAEEGTVIGLVAGTYGDIVIRNANGSAKKGITLVSNRAVVASVNLNGSTNITIDGLTFDASKGTTVWSFSNQSVTSDSGNIASITDATEGRANYGAQNITIKNCSFTDLSGVATAAADNYYSIMTGSTRKSQANTNYTVENCLFACNAVQYVALNYVNGDIVVRNNKFGGGNYGTTHNTIGATSSGANWTITGNDFNNWNVLNAAIGSSRSTVAGIVTWSVTGNHFNNAVDAVVLALKVREDVARQDSYKDTNSVVVFENNTALNGNGTFAEATRNAKDDEDIFHGKKIQLKAGVSIVDSTDALQHAIAAGDTTIIVKAGEYLVDLYSIAARDSLTIIGQGASTKLAFKNQQVRASQFKELTISNCTIERMPNKSWGHLVFGGSTEPGGVYTISNCVFNGVGSQGVYINQYVEATFNIENCTFNGDFGGEGAITIANNDGVNVTVNVTDCEFNNIPESSHEICALYAYEGWTLNAEGITAYWKAKQ